MGKFDEELTVAFEYVAELNVKYTSIDQLPALYQELFNLTNAYIDRSAFLHDLSSLLNIDDIETIKGRIRQILRAIDCNESVKKTEHRAQLIEQFSMSIINIVKNELSMEPKAFIEIAQDKQVKKNIYYGDIWYKRGIEGVCRDMGRKVVRLSRFDKMIVENQPDAIDTLADLLVYCVFYLVLIWGELHHVPK